MRLSSLVVAVILLVPTFILAQHSSGGGVSSASSSSGSSSSFSSASSASHSSYSGASSSSASFASSHGSSSSAAHSSTTGSASRSGGQPTRSDAARTIHNSRASGLPTKENLLSKSAQPEKRNLFTFLRHPFRKVGPKRTPGAKLVRPPKCKHGPCPPSCPQGICALYSQYQCSAGEYWNGGVCNGLQSFRLSDCSALVLQLSQQAQRMQLAEGARQASCSLNPPALECANQIIESQNEADRYRELQQQYQECERRRLAHNLFGGRLDLPRAN